MGFYRRHILPRVLDLAMRRPDLRAQREWLLAQARGAVLEIGFGGGLNLPFYSREVTALTAVEPDPGMRARAMKRIEASGRTVSMIAKALETKRLPLASDSFDTVVSTWTMCTLPEPELAVREINRLLKPGGRFLFVEHGLSPDAGVAKWQRRLTPMMQRIGGGCHLDRNIEAIVRGSPLSVGKFEQFYLPGAMRLGGYTYRGVAVKG